MELKTLTTEEQIEILRTVRRDVLDDISFEGLCFKIQYFLRKVYKVDTDTFNLKNYIPLFRIDYAIAHAKAGENRHSAIGYWWDRYNIKDRLAFLDWMTTELKKQLKD